MFQIWPLSCSDSTFDNMHMRAQRLSSQYYRLITIHMTHTLSTKLSMIDILVRWSYRFVHRLRWMIGVWEIDMMDWFVWPVELIDLTYLSESNELWSCDWCMSIRWVQWPNMSGKQGLVDHDSMPSCQQVIPKLCDWFHELSALEWQTLHLTVTKRE
jgi:hypothetical protein